MYRPANWAKINVELQKERKSLSIQIGSEFLLDFIDEFTIDFPSVEMSTPNLNKIQAQEK